MASRFVVAFAVALVVVAAALGGQDYYTYTTLNTRLSNDNATLTSQIASLEGVVSRDDSTLSSQISSLGGVVSANNVTLTAEIGSLRSTLAPLQSQLTQIQQSESSNAGQIAALQTELRSVNASINAVMARLASLFPQVPLTTLVITNDTYDSATSTFTFRVQNTQTYTVIAQLSAILQDYCNNGYWWYYTSKVYTFSPQSTLSVPMNLALSYQYPNIVASCNAIYEVSVQFVIPPSTAVSQTYNFQVSPTYDHP
jgi:hypothetical protein